MRTPPKFTPGPWKAVWGQHVLAVDEQMMICDIRGWGYLTGVGGLHLSDNDAIEIQDANSRLIAAAPALYEIALKLDELDWCIGYELIANNQDILNKAQSMVRNVLESINTQAPSEQT